MRIKDDITATVSRILTDVRTKKGFSKTKMAEYLGVDKHTWIRWESGANSPSLEDLIMIFDKLGEPLLPALLDILYPQEYEILHEDISTTEIRKQAAIHFLDNESNHNVRIWHYIMNSMSRTELHAQIEEFCAIDHLPVQFKYFIAEQVYVYYMTSIKSGSLTNTDKVMPDMDTFAAGLIRTQKSAFDELK